MRRSAAKCTLAGIHGNQRSTASQHALRGDDAVDLACALQLQGDDIRLATWDNALNAAACAIAQLVANDTG